MKTIIQFKKSRVIIVALVLVACVVSYFVFSPKPTIGTVIITDERNVGVEGVYVFVWMDSAGGAGPFYTDKNGKVNCGTISYRDMTSVALYHEGVKKGILRNEITQWPLKLKFNGKSFESY
jgi:hypothetical protein